MPAAADWFSWPRKLLQIAHSASSHSLVAIVALSEPCMCCCTATMAVCGPPERLSEPDRELQPLVAAEPCAPSLQALICVLGLLCCAACVCCQTMSNESPLAGFTAALLCELLC